MPMSDTARKFQYFYASQDIQSMLFYGLQKNKGLYDVTEISAV